MTITVKRTQTAPSADAHRRAWISAVVSIVAVLAVVAPFFAREIGRAVHTWLDSTAYNHCFLILPIVLYLVWNRRGALADIEPRPAPMGLAATVLLSLLWIFAAKFDVVEARQFLFIGIVQSILFTMLGVEAYRRLLGPLLYLFFLVPSGEFLVPKLQDITAGFAVWGLHAVGVPVFSDGVFIEIPEGNFVIAEACAGLRFLVASIAYGVLFALLVYRAWWKRAVFIALSIIVPIIANGLRAFGIIFAAHVIGSAQAAEADHILYGWLFFSLVIFLLTLLGMSFSQTGALAAFPLGRANVPGRPIMPEPKFYKSIAVLTALVAIAAPALVLGTQANLQRRGGVSIDFPQPLPPWHPQTGAPEWNPALAGADRELLDSFTDGSSTVERYVAVYTSHGDDNIVRNLGRSAHPTGWERAGTHAGTIEIGGHVYPAEIGELRSGGQVRLVWSFYIVGDKVIASTIWAKLSEGYSSLIGRGQSVAFVALSTPIKDQNGDPSATLSRFAASLPSLDRYIASLR